MLNIKVLGTGCANCKTTLRLIETVAKAKGVAVELTKVEDLQAIMSYGVMATPGVVVNGKVVHAGGIPAQAAIAAWLTGANTPTDSGSGCCQTHPIHK